MAFLRETLAGTVTVHQGHMPEIDLTSATTATGIWALHDIVIWPNGMRLDGYGHYHETYAKADGEWRITSSKLTRLHMDFVDAGAELMSVAVVTGAASGIGLALVERCAALGMAVDAGDGVSVHDAGVTSDRTDRRCAVVLRVVRGAR